MPLQVTVESKADSTYPIVSAASICAKVGCACMHRMCSPVLTRQVTRDRVVRHWAVREKGVSISRQFGSGYPSDPTTKQWLRDHFNPVFGFPGATVGNDAAQHSACAEITRFSWSTAKKLMDDSGVVCVPRITAQGSSVA